MKFRHKIWRLLNFFRFSNLDFSIFKFDFSVFNFDFTIFNFDFTIFNFDFSIFMVISCCLKENFLIIPQQNPGTLASILSKVF